MNLASATRDVIVSLVDAKCDADSVNLGRVTRDARQCESDREPQPSSLLAGVKETFEADSRRAV